MNQSKYLKKDIGLSLAQVLPGEINIMLSLNNSGFIDVNRTVLKAAFPIESIPGKIVDFLHSFIHQENLVYLGSIEKYAHGRFELSKKYL